jgi:hypothetical protein
VIDPKKLGKSARGGVSPLAGEQGVSQPGVFSMEDFTE